MRIRVATRGCVPARCARRRNHRTHHTLAIASASGLKVGQVVENVIVIGELDPHPLRRYFVRDMHGRLPYPKATAITEVLVSALRSLIKGKATA
jgi:hypothetical protein